MVSNSCYSSLFRAINTKPLVCFSTFKYPLSSALNNHRFLKLPNKNRSSFDSSQDRHCVHQLFRKSSKQLLIKVIYTKKKKK